MGERRRGGCWFLLVPRARFVGGGALDGSSGGGALMRSVDGWLVGILNRGGWLMEEGWAGGCGDGGAMGTV